MKQHARPIGGPGTTVEIDESDQVWQDKVSQRSLHRRTVGLWWHLPRNQGMLPCSGRAQGERDTLANYPRSNIGWNTRDERHVESLRLPTRRGLSSPHS